jgi:hypothetical protein
LPRVVGQKLGHDQSLGHDVYAPIVVVTVSTANGCIATRQAMIDSGADCTIIPFEQIKACGVEWDKLPDAGGGTGAGGKFETRILMATVKYREWVVSDRLKVAEPGSLPLMLLGRQDFFRKFNVRFRWDMVPPVVDVDPFAKK